MSGLRPNSNAVNLFFFKGCEAVLVESYISNFVRILSSEFHVCNDVKTPRR